MTEKPVHVRAHAKINLCLAVKGRRPDGFHEIESWVVPIQLFDELEFGEADRLILEVSDSSLSGDSTNLVWRAAEALASAAGIKPAGRMLLRKGIPIGGGLGGGSSDAATTLLALNRWWKVNWPVAKLAPIAESLGSDVPFFLQPRSAILRGRGERVESMPRTWKGWFVLIVPPFGISTIEVYRQFDADTVASTASPEPWEAAWTNSQELSQLLCNDLLQAAFGCESRLERLHARLNYLDNRLVHMTGSGSVLFAIFDTQEEAQAWAQRATALTNADCHLRVVQCL